MVLLAVLACVILLWWIASSAVEPVVTTDSMVASNMASGDGSQAVGEVENKSGPKPTVNTYGRNSSTNTPASQCPVRLPADCLPVEHSTGASTERWQTRSNMLCRDAAYELLLDLRSDEFLLNKAGFLDLSDRSWGCTVTNAVGDVFVVSMIPESLSAARNDSNRLTITVVRIVKPSFSNGQELG